MNNRILEIRNLSTYFFVDREEGKNYSGNYGGDVFTDSASAGFKIPKNKIPAKAVDDVSFDVYEGEITGLIGESGSGKSVTAYSVLGLIQEPEGKIVSGSVSFKGVNLLELSQEEIRKYRGREISMIFQEPREALNPVMKIKNQLSEVLSVHEKVSESEAEKRIIETMSVAGIAEPERIMKEYPHRLSGGM